MDKLWSKTEVAHLKRYASQSLDELAQRFHTTADLVRDKMEELGLMPSAAVNASYEASIEQFGEAASLMHDKKYKEAADILERVVADTDGRHLVDRARQYLEICQQHLEAVPATKDPYLAAVVEKNKGNLDGAIELCSAQGGKVESDERFAYLAASLHAIAGDDDAAFEHLGRAIALEPKNRVHAYHDPDFKSLRKDERFSASLAKA